MTVREILAVIRRWWAVIAGCVLAGLVIATVLFIAGKPQYTSSARLLVATPNIDQNALVPPGGLSASQRAINYASLARGNLIPQTVISQLHLDETPTQLLQSVTVNVVSGTTLIQISTVDSDAAQAQAITQAFSDALVQYIPKVDNAAGETQNTTTVTVADPADLPPLPSPKNLIVDLVLGLIAGLVVAALVLRYLTYRDKSIRRERQLEELTQVPLLGTIPVGAALVGDEGDLAEAYRVLRSTLAHLPSESGSPALAVVAATSEDGSPVVAANLASSLALSGRRTVLVDGDPHHPRIGELVGAPSATPGLGDILAGSLPRAQATFRWEAGHCDVIVGGTPAPHPGESVQGVAMTGLLGELRESYDVVVVNTSPLLAVSDGAELVRLTQGALLVVRYGCTTRDQVSGALRRLGIVGATLFGTVLTDVPSRPVDDPDSRYRDAAVAGTAGPTGTSTVA